MIREDKEDILGFIFVLLIIASIFMIITHRKEYEYYANGKFGKSKDCYQTDDINCYCKVNNEYIKVDNYYVAE